MATCKFKVGDIVRRTTINNAWNDGRVLPVDTICEVVAAPVSMYGSMDVKVNGKLYEGNNPQYFELVAHAEKIVITHDGKTTTATKYCGDGSKVTATARCAPEDEFNFEVGAKLALERLDEKVNDNFEWVVVNRKAVVGDYIRLKNDGGYDWNEVGDILRVDEVDCGTCVKVLGKNHIRETDDKNFAWAYVNPEYEVVEKRLKVETPKYYNGKVVCVSNDPCFGENAFTVGKIYNIVDGKFISNVGESRPITKDRITTVADLKNEYFSNWCYQFIPLVE